MNNNFKNRLLPFAILIACIVILPLITQSPYVLTVGVLIGIYSMITLGLSLLMGYAGQISIGQAAFFGIGAYSSGILTVRYNVDPWLAMLLGLLITLVISVLVGIPTLKLKEHFLALATIGFNVIVYILLLGLYKYTGGAGGLAGIRNLSLFGMSFRSELSYYIFVWIFVLLMALFSLNIVQSHIGRIMRGIHDSEVATLTQGINVAKYKLHIFIISALFASFAGSLYAHFMNFLAPSIFSIFQSVTFLLMVVVGGLQPIWGAIFGAAVVTSLGELVKHFVPMFFDVSGEVEIIIYGIVLILVVLFVPKGLLPALISLFDKRKKDEPAKIQAKEETSA
jgi:branched-chain amino acid transport system permease protein